MDERQVLTSGCPSSSWKDYAIVAVFSREASINFGRTWRQQHSASSSNNTIPASIIAPSSVGNDSESDMRARVETLQREDVGTDLGLQLTALLDNKTLPHVIVLIEGEAPGGSVTMNKLTSSRAWVRVVYHPIASHQGKDSRGVNDAKQNFHVMVREDMQGVYTAQAETIHDMHTMSIKYSTQDGKKYVMWAVHIPSRLYGSAAKNQRVTTSFKDKKKEIENSLIATCYFGDTNFNKVVLGGATPTLGGILPSNRALTAQGSSAKTEKNFMQVVGLGDSDSYAVLRPSALNYIFLDTDANVTMATDHPSFLHYIAHTSRLVDTNTGKCSEFDWE